jgi:hypothetical protein
MRAILPQTLTELLMLLVKWEEPYNDPLEAHRARMVHTEHVIQEFELWALVKAAIATA